MCPALSLPLLLSNLSPTQSSRLYTFPLLLALAIDITWKIEKAIFDLSEVKWLNDGEIEYDGGREVAAVLDPEALPPQLRATYSNNIGANVGVDDGRASDTPFRHTQSSHTPRYSPLYSPTPLLSERRSG